MPTRVFITPVSLLEWFQPPGCLGDKPFRWEFLATGATRFNASHPVSLGETVWRLPKDRYLKPVILSSKATVVNGGTV